MTSGLLKLKLLPVQMPRQLVHTYENDFQIDVKLCQKHYVSIKPFSPIPRVNLLFDFRALYEENILDKNQSGVSVFKLKLEKLSGFNINPALEFSAEIQLLYYESNYNSTKYKIMSFINVKEMSCLHFDKVVTDLYNERGEATYHKGVMNKGSFNLKCILKFYLVPHVPCKCEIKLKNRFHEEFKFLFKSEILSDVTFKINDQSIPAHKVMLVAHSPVFLAMLTQDFSESKTNTIEITDCTYEIFELFLKYFYLQEIQDKSLKTVMKLHVLSDKYDVSTLKLDCTDILISHMNVNSISEILKTAYDHNNDELKTSAMQFAACHYNELKLTENWKMLKVSHPLVCYEIAEKVIALREL